MSTLLAGDKYLINMIYAHWKAGTHHKLAMYDLFYRTPPFGGGFVVFVGLKNILEYVEQIGCTDEDIEWMIKQPESYPREFIDFVAGFKFSGDLFSMGEGDFAFPNEPMVKVVAPIWEAALIGSSLLAIVNYQSLVATKAARIRIAAGDDYLIEMGMRRASGFEAGIWAARAAHIAGFNATSNMSASAKFGINATGTMAHEWVQSFDSEYMAFIKFAEAHPDNTVLLLDTYSTLKSGIVNAIKVGKWLEERGHRLMGVRLDSGDLLDLSIKVRAMLNDAGLDHVKIVASNDLDEFSITELKKKGAPIDSWGVGTRLVAPGSLGAVFKLAAIRSSDQSEWIPTVKKSETPEKAVPPGVKWPYRIYASGDDYAVCDVILPEKGNPGAINNDWSIHTPLIEKAEYGTTPVPSNRLIFDASLSKMPQYVLQLSASDQYPVVFQNENRDQSQ